jgi:hypothetical protein
VIGHCVNRQAVHQLVVGHVRSFVIFGTECTGKLVHGFPRLSSLYLPGLDCLGTAVLPGSLVF